MGNRGKPNRLASERSPYLLQHAYNPVDWFPWSEEAFTTAVRAGKLIFLSIGYSTCHWCHVMAHESFEDSEVASYLNQHFVSIKVDREERPDVDQTYMRVCQLFTGRGGWPLTIIMTPEKVPFFAGTYLPKRAGFGMPGLMDVLESSCAFWKDGKVNAKELQRAIFNDIAEHPAKGGAAAELSSETLDIAFDELSQAFDDRYGGFGLEPKFPSPHNIVFLLRYWSTSKKPRALEMAEKTLVSMYQGGMYDHIGFGFCRYSTDRAWLVPHFEKMLYDNALIAYAFLEAFQATGNGFYGKAAREIFAYVERRMTSPEGGFYSAEDADSGGVEGGFYKWDCAGIEEALGKDEGRLFCQIYGVGEEEAMPNLSNASFGEIAKERGMSAEQLVSMYENGRARLYEAREARVHPARDEKVLTAWNGLMIAALAKGGLALKEDHFTAMAERCAGFLLSKLERPNGRLLTRYHSGEAGILGYLDDYAFLAWGLFELYEATFKAKYLEEALNLARQMVDLFWDKEEKGFSFSGIDGEKMPWKLREVHDGAMPSGNSVAAMNILKLWHITGDERLAALAKEQVIAFSHEVSENPSSSTFFLCALQYFLSPSGEVVVCGEPSSADTVAMVEKLRSFYLPNLIILMNPASSEGEEIRRIVPSLAGKDALAGSATAYICENYACRRPITKLEGLGSALKQK